MKILHVINTLSAGGAELHLLTLCRCLKRKGVEIVVVCLREQVRDSRSLLPDFIKEKIRVVNLRADGRYDSSFFRGISGVLSEERPDILHTHLPRADLAGAFGRFLHPSIPWVCSVHAIYSEDWSARWSLPIFGFLWRRADVIVCISHAVRDWLLQRGMPAAKARVIYYGIEPGKFSLSKADSRQSWSPAGRAVIGTMGRLEPRKGHDCLIKAMPEVCRHVSNAALLIAGHDPWGYGKELRRLIDELDLTDKVRLVGFQNDVSSFLNNLDVFAFASNSEGFGQVLVEAMAAIKPAVVSKIAPLDEIAVHGVTGLLVERGNPRAFARALSWILQRPDEQRRMGVRGQERVRSHFSAQRMTDEILSLYDELVGKHSQQRLLA